MIRLDPKKLKFTPIPLDHGQRGGKAITPIFSQWKRLLQQIKSQQQKIEN